MPQDNPRELILTGDIGSATIQAAAEKDPNKPPAFSMLAYSGGVMNIEGWGPVVLDVSGLELPEPGRAPVLVDHDRKRAGVVGHGSVTANGDGSISVEGVVSGGGEAAAQIIRSAASGFPWRSSVGVRPTRTRRVPAGESETVNGKTQDGPFNLVEEGLLYEVSFVSIGADPESYTHVAANAATQPTKETDMPEDIAKKEKQRIENIRAMMGGWEDSPAIKKAAQDICAQGIENGDEPGTVSAKLIEVVRASRPAAALNIADSTGSPPPIQASIMTKMGFRMEAVKLYGEEAVDRAVKANLSAVDICGQALRENGQTVPHGKNEIVQAAFSSSSAPTYITTAVNNVIELQRREAASPHEQWCAIRDTANFLETKGYLMNSIGNAHEVGSDGELKHAKPADEHVYTWQAGTYGQVLTLTRQHMANDELGMFQDVVPSLVKAANRKLRDLVIETLLANGAAPDGTSFFDDSHGNLITDALDVTTGADAIAKAWLTMAQQRDGDGNDLDFVPAVLAVPPELAQTAKQILESERLLAAMDATASALGRPDGNPLKTSLDLAVEPRLSNTDKFGNASATAWYVFAGPADMPQIVGYLNGNAAPTVEFFGLDHSAKTLGYCWRSYWDFGTTLAEYRAAVKSTGTDAS